MGIESDERLDSVLIYMCIKSDNERLEILWIFNRKKIKSVNMSRKVLKFYAKGKKI